MSKIKTRLWVCRSCGKAWRRYRADTEPPHYCCGKPVVKARAYPKRKKPKHQAIREKIAKFRQTYCSKPRTNIGTVLRISSETRKAFRHVLKAKQKPTLLKRAQAFIDVLQKDVCLYNTSKDKETCYTKQIDQDGKISRSKGGITNAPKVVFENGCFDGEYLRSFMDGKHNIKLRPGVPIEEMKGVLVHEAMHYVDDLAETKTEGHDLFWSMRLKRFAYILGYKGEVR